MAAQGMLLRNMQLVGGHQRRVEMPSQNRPVFEEGAALIFMRWTALQLGVQNEWGGSKSAQKAQELLQDVIGWFYNTKDHEMCDLQDLLDEALQLDFSIQAEDDSPYQVARMLVNMHNQVATGDFSFVQQMRQQVAQAQAQAAAAASQRVANGVPDADEDSSSDEDEDDEGGEDGMDAEGGEDMDMDDAPAAHPMQQQQQQQQPQGPVVDEDGFQVVQRRGGRGGRR